MKKIYFAGSIRGGRTDAAIYKQIIDYIAALGHVPLTEHIGLKTLTSLGEPGKTEKMIYDRDIAWIKEADAIIAEVTNPSLGVGYEIAKAEEWNKPILALYRPSPKRKLSAMIAGSPLLGLVEYNDLSQAQKSISDFIQNL